jgi:hypothetical protein
LVEVGRVKGGITGLVVGGAGAIVEGLLERVGRSCVGGTTGGVVIIVG